MTELFDTVYSPTDDVLVLTQRANEALARFKKPLDDRFKIDQTFAERKGLVMPLSGRTSDAYVVSDETAKIPVLGRSVIKTLRTDDMAKPYEFVQHVEAISKLATLDRHMLDLSGLPRLIDYGTWQGIPAVAETYVDNVWGKEFWSKFSKLSPAQRAAYYKNVASEIVFLAGNGIILRDISTQNLAVQMGPTYGSSENPHAGFVDFGASYVRSGHLNRRTEKEATDSLLDDYIDFISHLEQERPAKGYVDGQHRLKRVVERIKQGQDMFYTLGLQVRECLGIPAVLSS